MTPEVTRVRCLVPCRWPSTSVLRVLKLRRSLSRAPRTRVHNDVAGDVVVAAAVEAATPAAVATSSHHWGCAYTAAPADCIAVSNHERAGTAAAAATASEASPAVVASASALASRGVSAADGPAPAPSSGIHRASRHRGETSLPPHRCRLLTLSLRKTRPRERRRRLPWAPQQQPRQGPRITPAPTESPIIRKGAAVALCGRARHTARRSC